MKPLILSNNPDRASFRQRIGIYLESLSQNDIHCRVEKLPDKYPLRWKLFKEAKNYDAVYIHKKTLNFIDAKLLRKHSRKIIYDFDDAVMYSPKRPNRDSLSHLIPFRRTVRLSDLVIAGNSYLANLAEKFNSNVKILPTGLDLNPYMTNVEKPDDGMVRLVWIGSKATLRYLLNIKPALEQVSSIYDNCVLRIICDDFIELDNMKVEKLRWSLKTEAEELMKSDIGLAPLPDNRFTQGKCGFKLLQYAAAGLAVVASPVGVNNEFVTDGISGFHASDNRRWASYISKLMENAKLRRQMGDAARKGVEKFDTKVIGNRLIELLCRCLGQARS